MPVDQENTGQAKQAAEHFFRVQTFLAENKRRHQYEQEHAGLVEDGGFGTLGVGQADVDEKVLQDRLEQAQQGDAAPGPARWPDRLAPAQAGEQQCARSGNGEADPGKSQLAGQVVGSDLHQLVAQLDHRVTDTPDQAAKQRRAPDDGPALKKRFFRDHSACQSNTIPRGACGSAARRA